MSSPTILQNEAAYPHQKKFSSDRLQLGLFRMITRCQNNHQQSNHSERSPTVRPFRTITRSQNDHTESDRSERSPAVRPLRTITDSQTVQNDHQQSDHLQLRLFRKIQIIQKFITQLSKNIYIPIKIY